MRVKTKTANEVTIEITAQGYGAATLHHATRGDIAIAGAQIWNGEITGAVVVDGKRMPLRAAIDATTEAGIRAAREAAHEAAVPGYRALTAAISAEGANYERTRAAIESGDGVLPSTSLVDVDSVRRGYPVAAACIRAESYADASNDQKAAAGRKAVNRILAGENYAQVIVEMNAQWREAAKAAVWAD